MKNGKRTWAKSLVGTRLYCEVGIRFKVEGLEISREVR